MAGNDQVLDSGAFPSSGLEEFLLAADRAGERGLEESAFRTLAASVRTAIVNEFASVSSRKRSLLEKIADLCGEGNTNTVVRDEVHRLTGRLLADLPADIQSHLVGVCLRRLGQDLLGGRDTRTWRPIAYVLAANYSLIKSRKLRRQLIGKLKSLTGRNPAYKNDFFLEDLLLIHKQMRLGSLEELKEQLDARQAGEKQS
jgi:hypothetical protein